MMMFSITFVSLLALSIAVPIDDNNCGYKGCPKYDPDVLNVHIVPHTHDDVGWLKTVDQYYFGSRNNIQNAGVQYILDSVIKELWADPKRRFIYVETAFFWKWWMRQTDTVHHKVHVLVRQGRLQFVGGAWSMNDEAAAHYHSTIDQFTWGLSKLNRTFGPCALPRVGWQIDPFGHSREFASLLKGMGYDGLFLGRIDYQDKSHRTETQTMEMLWRGDDDLGNASEIFTGVLYNTYSPPSGFCFDLLCSDEPIIDDPLSPMYNVDTKVYRFIEICRNMSKAYLSRNILVTMGEDFQYQDALVWFTNLDKLIEYTNLKAGKDGLNIKLFYSTPNCYLKSVKEANPSLPIKQDDFFPYASDPNSYWTGYFTSRPTTKYFERNANNYLQMLKQIQTLSALPEHNMFVLNELKSAMGIMQHHDAITGTEKQHVARDYERILTLALDDALIIARQGLNKEMRSKETLKLELFNFERCHLNESRCDTSENSKQFVVTVYNPSSWTVKSTPVRIPVTAASYSVIAPNGEEIVSQMVEIPPSVRNIYNNKSKATHEIVFEAYDVKALGFKSFYIQKKAKETKEKREVPNIIKTDQNDKIKDVAFINTINDYWKTIKDNSFIDLKSQRFDNSRKIKLNSDVLDKDNFPVAVENDKIPDAPLELDKIKKSDKNENLDLNILKDDKNDDLNEHFKELQELIEEAKKEKEGKTVVRRKEVEKATYPELNDEEMRMLGDDPQTVERYHDDGFLENQNTKIRINYTTGQITGIILPDGTEASLTIAPHYYTGCYGNNEIPQNRSSGAYIFRPNSTRPTLIELTPEPVIKGPVVQEMRFTSEFVNLAVKLYSKSDYFEVDWTVGPIPIDDGTGKEVIIKYSTDIVNNGEFYTDSNGRQMLKRQLNKRRDWNLTVHEPVAGNYYPVTNEMFIKDDSLRLTVYTDRSQGGASLEEGAVEAMVHRRLLHDDAFGVGEALNETVDGRGLIARGSHRVYLTKNDMSHGQVNFDSDPLILVSNAETVDLAEWLTLKNCLSLIKNSLPDGVKLLTVEPWVVGKSFLVRLENTFNRNGDKSSVEVDLREIFKFELKELKETTLSGNMWLEDDHKFTWNTRSEFGDFGVGDNDENKYDNVNKDNRFKVSLKAKQIRTFVIEV